MTPFLFKYQIDKQPIIIPPLSGCPNRAKELVGHTNLPSRNNSVPNFHFIISKLNTSKVIFYQNDPTN